MSDTKSLPRAARTLAFVLASLLAAAGAQAGDRVQAQANLVITVKVPRHASLRMKLPPTLTITEADLARGYVEVPGPVELTVHSNVRDGYTLLFERVGGQVRAAQVEGVGQPLVVAAAPALASRGPAGRGLWQDVVQLRFRFELAAAATAGEHPWPLRVSMMSN